MVPSIIFRGPFGIFEGHELMEKNTTKNGLTIKLCFEHCKAHSFTLKVKNVFFLCERTVENVHLLVRQESSIVREEIVPASMTKMF